jgi:hypothetical protein
MRKKEDQSEDEAAMKTHDQEIMKFFYPGSLMQEQNPPKSKLKKDCVRESCRFGCSRSI